MPSPSNHDHKHDHEPSPAAPPDGPEEADGPEGAAFACAWPSPPPPTAELALPRDEAQVWCAALDGAAERRALLWPLLSADEQERARRFRFDRDRDRFTVARGLLRHLLGRYLGVDPARLRFAYNAHGKPALEDPQPDAPGKECPQFNVSHSAGLALYACAREAAVGVDLERRRPLSDMAQVAARFFSSREQALLRALPPERRLDAFYACWTRKEAYVKARGEGLSLPLDRFSVSLAPGEPARLLHVEDDPRGEQVARWSLHDLAPAAGYAAALAVEGHGRRLVCRRWPA